MLSKILKKKNKKIRTHSRQEKKIIPLDLKINKDKVLAKKLISKADVLIEGFRPGVMERLGLGPKTVKK